MTNNVPTRSCNCDTLIEVVKELSYNFCLCLLGLLSDSICLFAMYTSCFILTISSSFSNLCSPINLCTFFSRFLITALAYAISSSFLLQTASNATCTNYWYNWGSTCSCHYLPVHFDNRSSTLEVSSTVLEFNNPKLHTFIKSYLSTAYIYLTLFQMSPFLDQVVALMFLLPPEKNATFLIDLLALL